MRRVIFYARPRRKIKKNYSYNIRGGNCSGNTSVWTLATYASAALFNTQGVPPRG